MHGILRAEGTPSIIPTSMTEISGRRSFGGVCVISDRSTRDLVPTVSLPNTGKNGLTVRESSMTQNTPSGDTSVTVLRWYLSTAPIQVRPLRYSRVMSWGRWTIRNHDLCGSQYLKCGIRMDGRSPGVGLPAGTPAGGLLGSCRGLPRSSMSCSSARRNLPMSIHSVPSTLAYGQRCQHPDCPLEAWCSWCGGSCLLHCVGSTTWWRSLRYFWRAWRRYVKARLA